MMMMVVEKRGWGWGWGGGGWSTGTIVYWGQVGLEMEMETWL